MINISKVLKLFYGILWLPKTPPGGWQLYGRATPEEAGEPLSGCGSGPGGASLFGLRLYGDQGHQKPPPPESPPQRLVPALPKASPPMQTKGDFQLNPRNSFFVCLFALFCFSRELFVFWVWQLLAAKADREGFLS